VSARGASRRVRTMRRVPDEPVVLLNQEKSWVALSRQRIRLLGGRIASLVLLLLQRSSRCRGSVPDPEGPGLDVHHADERVRREGVPSGPARVGLGSDRQTPAACRRTLLAAAHVDASGQMWRSTSAQQCGRTKDDDSRPIAPSIARGPAESVAPANEFETNGL